MGTRLPPSSTREDVGDLPEQVHDTGRLEPSAGRRARLHQLAPALVAFLLAGLVVLPWMQRGWLLLLDWAPAPHQSLFRSFWGLDRGLQTSLFFGLFALALAKIVGAATSAWLVIFGALAIAGISAGRLAGGSTLQRIAAGTLYALNPLIFERTFAGHVGYLLAYALLPLAVLSIVRWRDEISWRGMRPALWLALLIALTPHFFWIGGVVLLAHVVTSRARTRALAWSSLVIVATVVVSAYFVVPAVGRSANVSVGEPDLAAYRTRADPTVGLAVNVAGLYGFWRPEPKLPKKDVGGWPIFLGAIALLAGTGLLRERRSGDGERRHRVHILAVSGGLGLLLALGDQGPTGPVFRLLFDRLPGFAIMREPQKFVALLALAYAIGFGCAVDELAGRTRRLRGRLAVGALAVGLPILYTPTLLFGLAGRTAVTSYPASWAVADRLVGEGDGKVLSLPWHQYLAFPFTGRIIANPADSTFRRDVIEGDNVELANLATSSTLTRSAYLEFLYANGDDLCAFGRLVAPLGVEYVALATGADSTRYRPWLDRQVDLKRVLDRPEMALYRNTAYVASGAQTRRLGRVAHWGELASLANSGALGPGPYVADRLRPGPITPSACGARLSATPGDGRPGARATSPVSYRLPGGPAGIVELPEPFDPSWHLGGRAAVELAGGTVGLATDGAGGTARFGHWNRVRAGYGLSLLAVAVLATGGPVAGRLRHSRAAKRSGD